MNIFEREYIRNYLDEINKCNANILDLVHRIETLVEWIDNYIEDPKIKNQCWSDAK